MSTIRTGYIRSLHSDLVWFLGLPFFAVAVAMGSHQWLPFAALASFNLWITIPHHFSTWFRAYSLTEDWTRWKWRFIVGPVLITGTTLATLIYAPLTAVLVFALWDHQHSVMQQHGFARIYDFKARAGSPSTGKFDLGLGAALYLNMVLTAPLWVEIWIYQLYQWNLPISASTVQAIQWSSWTVTGTYLCVYIGHVVRCAYQGYAINPIKYLFILASYALWYFCSWHTDSLLVYGIAHRIMHGVQYIVIVYFYLEHKAERTEGRWRSLTNFSVWKFAVMALVYALLYQLVVGRPLEQFGFGIPSLFEQYSSIPEIGLEGISTTRAYDIYAATIANSFAMTHYYFDSFIWKVSDAKTQEGL